MRGCPSFLRLELNVSYQKNFSPVTLRRGFEAQSRSGGKSELSRARRSLAATGSNPKESATERETVYPPMAGVRSEKLKVKSCCNLGLSTRNF